MVILQWVPIKIVKIRFCLITFPEFHYVKAGTPMCVEGCTVYTGKYRYNVYVGIWKHWTDIIQVWEIVLEIVLCLL